MIRNVVNLIGGNTLNIPTKFTKTVSAKLYPENIYDMTYGNGVYVAVGTSGIITYSVDGLNWTRAISPLGIDYGYTLKSLYSVCYANGIFIATGNTYILYSTDGIIWSIVYNSTSTGFNLDNITHDGVRFIVTGYYSAIVVSTDGINWTLLPSSFGSERIYSLAYGNGKYIYTGNSNQVYRTTSGYDPYGGRAVVSLGLTAPYAAFGNGIFVIIGAKSSIYGYISTSTDGINWVTTNSPVISNLTNSNILFSNGYFIVKNSSTSEYWISSDGLNWSLRKVLSVGTVKHLNGKRFTYGINGTICMSTYIPNDTISGIREWNVCNTNAGFKKIIKGNGAYNSSLNIYQNYIAVGGIRNHIYVSSDSINWKSVYTQIDALNNEYIENIVYFNGLFIIYSSSTFYLYYSTDLVNWTKCGIPTSGLGGYKFKVINNVLFLTTNLYLYYTYDGITWNYVSTAFASRTIEYGNGVYVIVGENNKVYISTDGLNWSTYTTATTIGTGNDMVFANGMFVLTSTFGKISVSTDGINWTIVKTNTYNSNNAYYSTLNSITYDNESGFFIAVGTYGVIVMSTDGINWIDVYSSLTYSIEKDYGSLDNTSVLCDSGKIICTNTNITISN